jgi:hypothetical protein
VGAPSGCWEPPLLWGTSIASIVSTPILGDISGLRLPSAWQRRALESDLRKGIIAKMEAFEPAVLIVDLVNERCDLMVAGPSLMTRSQEFVNGGGDDQPWTRGARRISRLSPEAEQLWTDSVYRFRERLRASPVLSRARDW